MFQYHKRTWFQLFSQTVTLLAEICKSGEKNFALGDHKVLRRRPFTHTGKKVRCTKPWHGATREGSGHGVPYSGHGGHTSGHGVPNTTGQDVPESTHKRTRGHGVPKRLGRAARRPRQRLNKLRQILAKLGFFSPNSGQDGHTSGHGAPKRLGHTTQRPRHSLHKLCQLLAKLGLFSPHECTSLVQQRATTALHWLEAAPVIWRKWQWFHYLVATVQYIKTTRHGALLPAPPSTSALVAVSHQQSSGDRHHHQRGGSRYLLTTLPFHQGQTTSRERNPASLGNNPGVPGSRSFKRNSPSQSTAPYTVVRDRTGRKTSPHNRLQGTQQVFPASTLQIGKLGGNFSLFAKRYVGSEDRPQACLLSYGLGRTPQTIHVHQGGRKNLPVSSGLFRPQRLTTTVAEHYESVLEKVEKPGHSNLGIFRRHTFGGKQPQKGAGAPKQNVARLRKCWYGGQHQEVLAETDAASRTFGFSRGLGQGSPTSATTENENHSKGTGQTFNKLTTFVQKSGSHPRRNQSLSHGNALFKGFHRPTGPICKPTTAYWLGSKGASAGGPQGTGTGNALLNGALERENFPRSHHSARAPLRLFPRSMGRGGHNDGGHGARILEGPKGSPHQRQGAGSSYKHGAIPCTSQRTRVPKSGQLSDLCIPFKRWGENSQLKRSSASFFKVVHAEENNFRPHFSEKCRRSGGRPQSVGSRPWGLYLGQKTVQNIATKVRAPHPPSSGYVCLPRQPSITTVRGKISTLAGHRSGRPEMSFGPIPKLLCQPPLENNFHVATQASREQAPRLPHGGSLLGFQCLVAPTCEAARATQPSVRDTAILGDVQELLGRIHATAQVAPTLCATVRQGLQRKQVTPEAATAFLKSKKCLPRYDKAFKLFWAYATIKGACATSSTLTTIAGLLLEFDKILPQHSKQAYAALLLIPDLEQLTFQPLLRSIKRSWNTSQVRYAAFYDAALPLERLGTQPLNWSSSEDLRTRLILVLRFLMLCRSIDLERLYRAISFVGETPYVLIRRKGQLQAQWEALVQVDVAPHLCPWKLLQAYVALTHNCVSQGSEVFITTKPPYRALKANSIGSLTRNALQKLGVNTQLWKPHSTRGAGVTMFKRLGFTSEEVCEIGKWKNVGAFTSHYLRLGAAQKVGLAINSLVHRVSPFRSAEPDLPRTAGTKDPAGRGKESEAQDNGEPARPSQDEASNSSMDLVQNVEFSSSRDVTQDVRSNSSENFSEAPSIARNAPNFGGPPVNLPAMEEMQGVAPKNKSKRTCPIGGRAMKSRNVVRQDRKSRKTVGPPTSQKSRNSVGPPTEAKTRKCAGPPYARFSNQKGVTPDAPIKAQSAREPQEPKRNVATSRSHFPACSRSRQAKRARSASAPSVDGRPHKKGVIQRDETPLAFRFAADRANGDHQPPPRSDKENAEKSKNER